jgi:hypothetical protein
VISPLAVLPSSVNPFFTCGLHDTTVGSTVALSSGVHLLQLAGRLRLVVVRRTATGAGATLLVPGANALGEGLPPLRAVGGLLGGRLLPRLVAEEAEDEPRDGRDADAEEDHSHGAVGELVDELRAGLVAEPLLEVCPRPEERSDEAEDDGDGKRPAGGAVRAALDHRDALVVAVDAVVCAGDLRALHVHLLLELVDALLERVDLLLEVGGERLGLAVETGELLVDGRRLGVGHVLAEDLAAGLQLLERLVETGELLAVGGRDLGEVVDPPAGGAVLAGEPLQALPMVVRELEQETELVAGVREGLLDLLDLVGQIAGIGGLGRLDGLVGHGSDSSCL